MAITRSTINGSAGPAQEQLTSTRPQRKRKAVKTSQQRRKPIKSHAEHQHSSVVNSKGPSPSAKERVGIGITRPIPHPEPDEQAPDLARTYFFFAPMVPPTPAEDAFLLAEDLPEESDEFWWAVEDQLDEKKRQDELALDLRIERYGEEIARQYPLGHTPAVARQEAWEGKGSSAEEEDDEEEEEEEEEEEGGDSSGSRKGQRERQQEEKRRMKVLLRACGIE